MEVKLFGVDIVKLYNYTLDKAYNFVKDNTDYLVDIDIDEVKDINFSAVKDIIILLKNGTVLVNGIKRLEWYIFVLIETYWFCPFIFK